MVSISSTSIQIGPLVDRREFDLKPTGDTIRQASAGCAMRPSRRALRCRNSRRAGTPGVAVHAHCNSLGAGMYRSVVEVSGDLENSSASATRCIEVLPFDFLGLSRIRRPICFKYVSPTSGASSRLFALFAQKCAALEQQTDWPEKVASIRSRETGTLLACISIRTTVFQRYRFYESRVRRWQSREISF